MVYAIIGFLAGITCTYLSMVRFKRRRRKNPSLKSITRLLFVTTQFSALLWVYVSYGIAIYSMVVLGQVYTLSEVAEPAISTIMSVIALKVAENIFEHNEGGVFGHSDKGDELNG